MAEIHFDSVLNGKLSIPPRPEVVLVLQEEMRKESADLKRVGQHISADVGLAGAMLKAVNSPAFGLARKVSAVPQALSLLGLRNAAGLATALVLRSQLGGGKLASMERFWDTAEKTALLCAHLAQRLRGIAPDEAYSVGLFHDCGIPILMQHRPGYKETLARANNSPDAAFTRIEEQDVGTHHGAVGYYLARSWALPDDLCQAILWHHDIEIFRDASVSDLVLSYIGIIHLAEHIQHRAVRTTPDLEWAKFETVVMDHFGLTEEDFVNLVDGAHDLLFDA